MTPIYWRALSLVDSEGRVKNRRTNHLELPMALRSITAVFVVSFTFVGTLAGCGSSADTTEDPQATTDDALDASKDPVAIANAKSFFEALLEDNTNRDTARIPYSDLPSKLAAEVSKNNPHPHAEWADEAYRAKVDDSHGRLTTVYAVVGGIDDEGESITLYTNRGKDIADGDDYRGFEWN
jgi:hypothetical protein